MKILILKKGNIETNVIVTEEGAERLSEAGYDEIRDVTNEGLSFEDLYNGKANTTPNWYFSLDLSDFHSMKVFADGKATPYGDPCFKESDLRGRRCVMQWFINSEHNITYKIIGMGVCA